MSRQPLKHPYTTPEMERLAADLGASKSRFGLGAVVAFRLLGKLNCTKPAKGKSSWKISSGLNTELINGRA